jgi:UPF0755 protein
MADPLPPDSAPPQKTSRFGRIIPRSPTEAIQPVAAPPPPPPSERRRGGLVNALSSFLSLVLVVALIAGGGLYMGRAQYQTPGPLASDKIVTVKGGATDVAEQLQHEGVIDHPFLFVAGLYILGKSSQIKAGEYVFKQRASLADVADTLVEGKTVLHSVTVPEGLTSQQIVDRLRENEILTGDVKEVPREGILLPDTYKFPRGMSRQQLVDRMTQEQTRVLREVWGRRAADLPVKSPQEMLVLASVVEKETGRADERSRVAAVFINRLNRGMKLQSDPTIVYGLVQGKGTLGRGITRSEITQPTAYNTYVIPGLPPGPIANPGRAALEAVASPSRTRELYFVADGTGGHIFAETYDQHLKNVARWRQIEGERRDAAPAETATQPVQGEAPAAPGVAPGAAGLPPATGTPSPSRSLAPGTPGARGAAAQTSPGGARNNIDAVAGTPKDPLNNRSFDLNSPKVVPAIRP